MGRKNVEAENGTATANARAIVRWALRIVPVVLFLAVAAQAFHSLEQFLIEDPRFRLGPAEGYAGGAASLRIDGIVHASRSRVESVFAEDAGKSIYVFPVAERRRRLLAVNWVKDATVYRIWPNQVRVSIRERQPVAFVQLPQRDGAGRSVALIDEEGVLLEPPARSEYDLPVLRGIEERQKEPARAVRVGLAMALIQQLGPLAEQVSEIDVAQHDNLAATMSVGGNGVTLLLGRSNFRSRVEHFLNHYSEIQRRLPNSTTFDLRLDDRITAVDGVASGA